ncbi:MAG: hypothetical protein ACRD0V_01285 [Acidimicrobiales bacterium]
MDRQGFDELVAIMGRLAQGDEAAVVMLYERFRGRIAGAVQQVAAARGMPLRPDDVEGVVVEVCFELARVAGAWSPDGGALPWVWARHRVANVVDRELGQWTEPLDEQQLAQVADVDAPAPDSPPAHARDASMWPALERVAADHHDARLLLDALERSDISRRDRELWLEYVCEKAVGNPAPATTVGPVFAMRASTVRQAARRVRKRVHRLATTDERFAPLAGLPVLA